MSLRRRGAWCACRRAPSGQLPRLWARSFSPARWRSRRLGGLGLLAGLQGRISGSIALLSLKSALSRSVRLTQLIDDARINGNHKLFYTGWEPRTSAHDVRARDSSKGLLQDRGARRHYVPRFLCSHFGLPLDCHLFRNSFLFLL